MPDPFRKVLPGESVTFTAATWNAFIDAALAEKQRRDHGGAPDLSQFRQADIIKIRNDSGLDLHRNSVLGLNGPIFTPSDSLDAFLREVTFTGVVPTSDHAGRFAVLLEPALDGRIARAYVAGVCQVKIDVTDEAHTCADVSAGDTNLLATSETGSAQILWREGDDNYAYGTGEQWAIVRFGSSCDGDGSGGGPTGRDHCDCPESHYEVTTNCGPCGKMPRYWWLTLSAASLASGATPCSGTDCADLAGLRFRLANNDDPDEAGCTWEISANGCITAELTWDAAGERWKLTLTDKDACVLGIWYAASADFACCGGPNATWTPDEANVCAVTISLAPDDCTCCPADPVVCPPDGLPFCESSTCCISGESNCTITVLVYDFDDPDPMGHVHDPANCLEMGGTYVMHWVGDCTWKGEIGTGTPEVYHATLTLAGSTWTLVINGSDGQTATLQATTCLPEVHLLLVSTSCQQVGGTPEVTGVDHATFTLAV